MRVKAQSPYASSDYYELQTDHKGMRQPAHRHFSRHDRPDEAYSRCAINNSRTKLPLPSQCPFTRLLDQIEFACELVQLSARRFCGSPRKSCNF